MIKKIIFTGTFLVLLSFAAGAQDLDPQDPGERNVYFQAADGTKLGGYLALPPGTGPFPAVLLIHEWWGLNKDTVILAEALAQEGFVVLAADAFRGSVARTPQDAMKQVTSTPGPQIASDLDQAYAYLAGLKQVDPRRIASWGFCFGGTQSMYMGTRNSSLAAKVIFYGSGPIQDPEKLGVIAQNGPLLGIYGEEDTNIPVSQVENFKKILDNAGAENTITIYPGVGHAFVKSTTYDQGGAPQKAWEQAVAFLKRNL